MKNICAYFSRAGENYFPDGLKTIEIGNTKKASDIIAKLTGCDLFEIAMKEPYSDDYKQCCVEAKKHKDENARPKLTKYLDSVEDYDNLIIAFPNYCSTIPMAVATFIDNVKLGNVKILVLCTNEGSGLGKSMDTLKEIIKDNEFLEPLSLMGHLVDESEDTLRDWLTRNNAM